MKVVIPGGSGHVGTLLARALVRNGHEVVVLSRRPQSTAWRMVEWDGEHRGAWTRELDGADAVVNLAGLSVNCRYHAKNRAAIMDSRLRSTRVVGEAIAGCTLPPRIWLQMSTATIYAHRYDAANDEFTGILGGDEPATPDTWRFSIDVARRWEAEAATFSIQQTRQVLLRTAMVMCPDRGGVFDTLLRLVRYGLGGTCGNGRQYVSWIHEVDFVRAIDWLIDHDDLSGPVNLAAPNPLPNAEFMRLLRAAWGVRLGLPASRSILELGTWLLRTESELILKSRRVVPGKLSAHGFKFQFASWSQAAAELCRRWKLGGDDARTIVSHRRHHAPS